MDERTEKRISEFIKSKPDKGTLLLNDIDREMLENHFNSNFPDYCFNVIEQAEDSATFLIVTYKKST
ncbi:MAG: hypothetical protein PHF63_00385 [Herbinix sp.]|nr:hypothetical protein [Herbinix sp.]